MLHRLALRIIPSLTLAVTEPEVRKKKRLVMLVPGLVAFAIYRAVQSLHPLTDVLVLLALSAILCSATAAWSYYMSRGASLAGIWKQDGPRRLGWLILWVGAVYGVQLSLLVLALCLVVTYDYRLHPAGPAMMALIIATTSVARDGFEIGVIRRLQHEGKPVLTFPDGASLRGMLRDGGAELLRWGLIGTAACMLAAALSAGVGVVGRNWYVQLAIVTLVAGSAALPAYLDGLRPGRWSSAWAEIRKLELLRFWAWPGLWFAATYYLVLVGAVVYPLHLDLSRPPVFLLMAALVGGMMGLYSNYLGRRRNLEDRILRVVPDSLLRCPFVMGILSKGKPSEDRQSVATAPPPDVALERAGPKG